MANYQVIDAYGSVITIQSSVFNSSEHRQIVGASIIGAVPVILTSSGATITSVMNTVPSSMLVGASIFGTVPITFPAAAASVVGLVFRNDTLASVLGVDLTFRQEMGDAAGRSIIKPFVSDDGALISFSGSVQSASVTLIAASIAGKRSYITDFWIANSGSVATIVQFRENTTSVIGVTIAPATGGSNSQGMNIPIRTSTIGIGSDLSFVGLTQTSTLYVTVKGYQAP